MPNVALLAHKPSEETLAMIRRQAGEWTIYQYSFHVDEVKDVEDAMIQLIVTLNEQLDIERAGRVIVALPGLGYAGAVMVEMIAGLSGYYPDILVQTRTPGGDHVPCPEKPFIELGKIRGIGRKHRSQGVIA